MATTTITNVKLKRKLIPYFEGVNSLVASNLANKVELQHAENARSKTIGSIEKREGTRRLGDIITATVNYGLFSFEEQSTATNTGFYRICAVGGTTSIYYLSTLAAWTALTGNGTSLGAYQFSSAIAERNCFLVNGTSVNRAIRSDGVSVYTSADLGDSTTQFDITNPAGTTYRYTYDTTGTNPAISTHVKVDDVIHIIAQNFATANKGAFTVTAVDTNYFDITNASGSAESNKTIGTGAIRVLHHLTNSPIANKINYYKGKLYLADYKVGSTQYKTGIRMSSMPLGIVGLVDGDHAVGVATVNVTDTKYIYSDDILDVYRGSTLIQSLIVTAKSENTITVVTTTSALNSADELWVGGTYGAKKVFRWADNSAGGVDVKQYDTLDFPGGQNDRIKMFTNIGDVMVIANKYNMAVWNDSSMTLIDGNIGCVSDVGWTKVGGVLYFLGYKGIYQFTGAMGEIPKLISAKVDPYITGATKANLEAGAMGQQRESIFCAINDITLYHPDGSVYKTMSDVVLEKDLRKDNWYPHESLKVTQFCTYPKTIDPDKLEFASTESGYHILELFNGQVDDRVTSDKEIAFRIDTHNITLADNFENICYPLKVVVEMERGSGVLCFVSLDNEPWYQIDGEAMKGCTIFKVTNRDPEDNKPPRCRQIRLSLRDFTNKLCKISRAAIIYAETLEEEEDKPEFYG